jgi:hypothetical protein
VSDTSGSGSAALLKVFIIVTVPVFAVAGAILLSLIAWTELRQYTRARLAIHRLAGTRNSIQPAINKLAFRKPR